MMIHGSPLGVIPVVFHGSPCLPAFKRKECRFSDAQNRSKHGELVYWGKVQPVHAWKNGLKSDDDDDRVIIVIIISRILLNLIIIYVGLLSKWIIT